MESRRKKVIVLATAFFVFTLLQVRANGYKKTVEKFSGRMQVETGSDPSGQFYYKPDFRFDLPLPFVTLFAQLYYYQVMNGSLHGQIDYWVLFGLRKDLSRNFKFEASINHMCRHLVFIDNPEVFNLNEIIGRLWFIKKSFMLGLSAGTYIGGTADYKNLFQLDMELPHLFGSKVSLRGEIKVVDYKEVLHEAELFFSIRKNTDIFIRNSRFYGQNDKTYIGIRMKSAGKTGRYIDSLNASTGVYPNYEEHKVVVDGNFKLSFFKTNKRRVIFSTDFTAPILRGETFLGDFNPEKMVYLISLQYLRKISKSLYLAWFNKYNLDMPVDIEKNHSASLAAGITLKNQVDFNRIKKRVRFDFFAGYNFKYNFTADIKLGASLVKRDFFNISTDLQYSFNKEKRLTDIRLFLEVGRNVTFRPFMALEKIKYLNPGEPVENKFSFGFALFSWLD